MNPTLSYRLAPLALALFIQLAVAQLCTFWDSGCVDPLAQTAMSISFQPLIIRDIALYYAFDGNPGGEDVDPTTKISFWITWNDPRVDKSIVTANRTSEIGMRVGNLTGKPGGLNNGCDNVWGPECSAEIKDRLKGAIYNLSADGDYYSRPLEAVLNQMALTPPTFNSCPTSLFDVETFPVEMFAQESVPDQLVTLHNAGSSDSPFKTWYVNNVTAKDQAEQVAVAILSRGPSYNSEPPSSPDDIQIELVCLRAPSSGPLMD